MSAVTSPESALGANTVSVQPDEISFHRKRVLGHATLLSGLNPVLEVDVLDATGDALAQMADTPARIGAASTDLAGAASQNGDWLLEAAAGEIEASALRVWRGNGGLGQSVAPQTRPGGQP